jgi:aminoglycoside phosphotransferase (APT) family kinase protein
MNMVARYVTRHWDRLVPDRAGYSGRVSFLLLTPRFRASSHVVFLVLAEGSPEPILVGKVPRLRSDLDSLHREAANLQSAHAARSGGFDSIPRVVVYEECDGNQLLLQTALVGQAMSPVLVQRQPGACMEAAMNWLCRFNQATADRSEESDESSERLVDRPMAKFRRFFPFTAEEESLLKKTEALTSTLRATGFPLVFEHGDLSAPNLFVLRDGSLGVVDWEMAEPRGLPAVDLFFFLTFVAFSRRRAEKERDFLAAFDEAFFGPSAWARPYVTRYAERMQLSAEVVRALFALCWSRYLSGMTALLSGSCDTPGPALEDETANWLRRNRYFSLWRHTLSHMENLNLIQ